MKGRLRVISVIGSAICTAEESRMAHQVGHLLAEQGIVVVCGGGGGVMEATCRGAHEAGGITLGLLPGSEPDAGNAYLSIAIPTGLGHARNVLVAQAGDAVIAIGGGFGTLSEIAIALKSGRRVIGLRTWLGENGQGSELGIIRVESAEEAAKHALGSHA